MEILLFKTCVSPSVILVKAQKVYVDFDHE